MWNRPDLTPTEQGAAYFGSTVSKGIPFFRHPARRNYGGEVQTDFGDSALANVAEAGTELGVGLGVNIGEQMLGARVAGMPGMLGAAGLSTASDATLAEQQKRVQRKEAPGTLGEDVSRGVGITMSGPDDTNLARGMRAASVPITMASTMLGVKMSRNVAALAKSAGGVTPEVIRRAALASFGGGATSVAETMVQKAGQGDTDFTNPAYWADPALSFFVGAAADAIGARGDVSDGLTQRAIADLKPTVDPNARPEAASVPPDTGLPPQAAELPVEPVPTPRNQLQLEHYSRTPEIPISKDYFENREKIRQIGEETSDKYIPPEVRTDYSASGKSDVNSELFQSGNKAKRNVIRTDSSIIDSIAAESAGIPVDQFKKLTDPYAYSPYDNTFGPGFYAAETGSGMDWTKTQGYKPGDTKVDYEGVEPENPLIIDPDYANSHTVEELDAAIQKARAGEEFDAIVVRGFGDLDETKLATVKDPEMREYLERGAGQDQVYIPPNTAEKLLSGRSKPPAQPKSEQLLNRLKGVETPPQPAAEPTAAAPPPKPPAPIPVTPDTNPGDIDNTLNKRNLEILAKKANTSLLTDSTTDTPETIEGLYDEATGGGYHKRERVEETTNRVLEAHSRGERPTLSPLEVAGMGVRMSQLELKRRSLVNAIASKTTPDDARLRYTAELNDIKAEFASIADARIVGGGNASMTLNAIRRAFPDLGPTGASLAKTWKMKMKQYADAGKTVPPDVDKAVRESFEALDKANEDFDIKSAELRDKTNELLAKEMPKESRPSTADEKKATIKRILDENNGCKT
jgi:hypothetical protein